MFSSLRISGTVAALVVAALLVWGARRPPVPVQAATARHAELVERVSTNGAVETLARGEIRARLAGRIVEIPEPGTRVEKGAVLLRIDPGPVAAELAAAESERLAARESLRAARQRLERVTRRAATDRELYEQRGMSGDRYRESQAELAEARAHVAFLEGEVPLRIASLDHRIEELRAQRDAALVRAPGDGTVYRTAFARGAHAAVGDTVLWFADLSRLRVRANVDQVDLGRVAVGQPVTVRSDAFPDRRWDARISELIPHVVRKESRFVAEGLATVAPPTGGLVPGMTVDVEIRVAAVPDALQVPAEAVFTDAEGAYVYRLENGRAERRPVRVGRSTVTTVEILEGLAAEDRVVTGPADGLTDGARVSVRNGGGGV